MVNNSLYASALGGMTALRRLDVLANNLSNAATPGFKVDRTRDVASVQHVSRSDFDKYRKGINNISDFLQVSSGFTQGTVTPTSRKLDVAISGEGFFAVQSGNETLYTRRGIFHTDSEGFLITDAGQKVLGEGGPIQVQGEGVEIDAGGTVVVGGEEVDRLKVVTFADPRTLTKRAGTSFDAGKQQPVAAEGYTVVQGALEMSNVNPVKIMAELIETQRLYDADLKGIQMANEINQKMTANAGRTK
jgi:flagellar basal-body rod protein FlgF